MEGKKKDYCKCKSPNIYFFLGGTINRLTPEGIETEVIKGDKPKCIDCKKYIKR